MISSVKPDRTDEDLLFQVLLDWGLDLGESIAVEELGPGRLLSVADDALIACFVDEVTDDAVRAIASRRPLRVVFLDAGFATDAARINAEQIFSELSPETEVRTI
jgi:adenine-specific DNA-methyltransferase